MHGRAELLCGCQGMRGAGVGVGEDEEVQEEEGVVVVVVVVGEDKVVQEAQEAQVEDKPMCRR